MAAAVFRFGMVFYGAVLVLLVLCNSGTVTGRDTKDVSTTVSSKPATPTTKSIVSSTTTAKGNSTTASTVRPTSSTVGPTASNSTAGPTSNGTKSTPTSKSTATPTAHGNHTVSSTTVSSTTVSSTTVSSTNRMIPTPTPEGHGTDRGKWVATAFAVFFLITTIVMTVLYCRQRKIYRELEGDSSLSRLI